MAAVCAYKLVVEQSERILNVLLACDGVLELCIFCLGVCDNVKLNRVQTCLAVPYYAIL